MLEIEFELGKCFKCRYPSLWKQIFIEKDVFKKYAIGFHLKMSNRLSPKLLVLEY